MKSFIPLLLVLPQLSFALDFYSNESSCENIIKTNPIKIKEKVNTSRRNLIKNKRDFLTNKMLDKINLYAQENGINSVYVKSFNTQYHTDESLKSVVNSKQQTGYAIFYPAINCDNSLKLTQREFDQFIKNKSPLVSTQTQSNLTLDFEVESKAQTSTTKHSTSVKPPVLADSFVSKNSFYGFRLGMDKKDVIKATNGFNLDIQLNAQTSMHIINRNHAFIFQNNKLIGYEYGRNLLPTMLANIIPLSELTPIFTLQNENISIHNNGLSQKEINVIKSINDSAEFIKIKRYSDGKTLTHLNSFKFGNTSDLDLNSSKDSCLNTNNLSNQTINNIRSNYLFRFNIKTKTKTYLTSCNQLITFKRNTFSELSLIEEINTKSASLNILDSLFSNISNWQFLNVEKEMSESQVVKKLNIDDAYMMNDILEFSNDNWQGYFTFNEDRVISAELSYFSSDE